MSHLKNLIFLIALGISIHSSACDCVDLGPLDSLRKVSFQEADLVFLGELISPSASDSLYTFRIIEKFKGNYRFSIVKGKMFNSCSRWPTDTGKWIVYADYKSGLIDIDVCLASRSELNPDCINCYPISSPLYIPTTDKEKKEFQKEMARLKAKARKDWKKEVELLKKKLEPSGSPEELPTSTLNTFSPLQLLLPKSNPQTTENDITINVKPFVDQSGNFIDANNRVKYYIENKEMSLANLQLVIEQVRLTTDKPILAIYADTLVPIDNIVQIMNIAKENGCSVILATAPE